MPNFSDDEGRYYWQPPGKFWYERIEIPHAPIVIEAGCRCKFCVTKRIESSENETRTRQENTNLRAALDAADRLAEMVRQHAAQHAGHHASSDITTVDIGQEYEFYKAAVAAIKEGESNE